MSGSDQSGERLRRALADFAAERVSPLIAEAEAEALAQARKILAREMAQALIGLAGEELSGKGPPQAPAVPEGVDSQRGYYVYGVVDGQASLPEGLVGIDGGHAPVLVRDGELSAIASHVPLSEFGEESLRENLNDVRWLEQKARAHEDVLDAILARATVVPMRLCTIYAGEQQVREMLRRERPLLLDSLRYLDGRAEMGVKAIAGPGTLEDEALRRSRNDADDRGASSGVQYLRRKRIQGRAREEAAEIADELAHTIHRPLADLAVEALLNPLQRPEVSGHQGDMILNGVYLVEERDLALFRQAVEAVRERFEDQGTTIELTGPWPPYNFVRGSIEAAR